VEVDVMGPADIAQRAADVVDALSDLPEGRAAVEVRRLYGPHCDAAAELDRMEEALERHEKLDLKNDGGCVIA
jgi:hypothetical protein